MRACGAKGIRFVSSSLGFHRHNPDTCFCGVGNGLFDSWLTFKIVPDEGNIKELCGIIG